MAQYRMEEIINLKENSEQSCYPRIVVSGQTTLNDLAKRISKESTFTEGDVLGCMHALSQYMALELSSGRTVKIDGIGTFSLSLGLRKGKEPVTAQTEVMPNARSIVVRNVHFRVDREWVRTLNHHFRPQRSQSKSRRSSDQYTVEERLALALQFLEKHPYLTTSDYCGLTGLLPVTARRELQKLSNDSENPLTVSGSGSHKVYVVRKFEA